jgi:chromosomal replication initiator protein
MAKIGGWEVVREAVRHRIGPSAFETWFGAVEGSIEADTLVLNCPDRFSRDWIRGRYHAVLQQITGGSRGIDYRVDPALGSPTVKAESPSHGEPARTKFVHPSGPSFEGFVAEPGNVLALEAARAVARGQAGHCSPLVLSGGSGLGKTHLCRAIRRETGERVVYRSSEEFTTEVTGAMRAGQMDPFRNRYRRSLNLLILEDVQFLAGKRATQVELFYTLDHLLSSGKAVVLSSDRPPHEIDGLDAKLASRMGSGLVACINPPELKTRLAILREKAASGGVRIPEDCLDLLARRPVQSVRDLLAGLNQVVARAALLRQPVSLDLLAEALAAVEVPFQAHSLEKLIEITAGAYGVSLELLRGRSRRRQVVRPRQVAMYLARQYTEAPLREIGLAFGRDHSSVSYAIEAMERRLVERPQLRYELEALVSRISPSRPADSGVGNTRGRPRT